MNDSNKVNDRKVDEGIDKSTDLDDDLVGYQINKPLSPSEYLKLLFYYVLVIIAGVLIAILMYLAVR